MITVWHRNYDDDRRKRIKLLNALDAVTYHKPNAAMPTFDLTDYTKVAIVDTDDPEETYAVVQNQGQDWQGDWQNHPLVLWGALPPQRASTEVGDLLQCDHAWLAVMAIGTGVVDSLLPQARVWLEPTGMLPLPKSSCCVIDAEVELMRSFLVEPIGYWVKGNRLCEWANQLLWARQLQHLVQPLNEQGGFYS